MFIPDMPNVPAQTPVVMIAQAGQAQDITKKNERILGICGVVDGDSDIVEIDPGLDANSYFWHYDKESYMKINFDDAKVTIVQQPKHGILTNGQWNSVTKQFTSLPEGTSQFEQNLYKYMPEPGYEGKDFAVISAEKDGVKVTIYYFLHATIAVNANYLCERPEGVWKISQDANGNPILTAVNYPSSFTGSIGSSTAASASTLSASILSTLSVDPSSVTFNLEPQGQV